MKLLQRDLYFLISQMTHWRAGQRHKLCDLTLTILRSGGARPNAAPTSFMGMRTRYRLEDVHTEYPKMDSRVKLRIWKSLSLT
jgi:hypothetical protein